MSSMLSHLSERPSRMSKDAADQKDHNEQLVLLDAEDTRHDLQGEAPEVPAAPHTAPSFKDEDPVADYSPESYQGCNVKPAMLYAGKLIFTVSNGKGQHYTYKISKVDPKPGSKWERFGPSYFIYLLTGQDNTRNYTYMGVLKGDPIANHPVVRLTTKSRYKYASKPVEVFEFAMKVIAGKWLAPEGYGIAHSGHCARCARVLTDPISLAEGMGPFCREQ